MEKLPRTAKQLRGTYRPDKDRKGLTVSERLETPPEPPETLSERAKTEWTALAQVVTDLGVLTAADTRTLALLCESLATASELEAAIAQEGFTVEGAGGTRKAHPALSALKDHRNAAARLLAEFGLSPKSRKYVEAAPRKADSQSSTYANLRTPDSGKYW